MMNKRILIFSTAYLPLIGGAEIAIKEITDRVGSFDFDLITARISRHLPKEEKIGNVHVYRVGLGSLLDKFLLPILGLPLALKLNKNNNYALAWAMMASQASVLAVFFAKLKKIKLLTTLQEGDEESYLERYVFGFGFLFNLFIRPWHRLAIKKANHIQVISRYLEDRAKQAGAEAQITVIPNGVDIQKFSQTISETKKQKLRLRLGILENEKVVLSVSRLVHKNAMDVLIDAMFFISHPKSKEGSGSVLDKQSFVLPKYDNNVKCIIIGAGPDEDKLKTLSSKLNIANRIIFLGRVDNKEIPEYLNISDLFVRPSRSEGQGIVFPEAMTAGVPIIATPVGGIVDFLHDNETGLFCKVDDPKDLAEKIKTLLFDKSLSEKISNNAKKMVSELYDWDKIAPKMEQLFIKIII